MALSLDYVGKFVIVLVTVGVGVGVILQMVPDSPLGPPGNDDEKYPQVVEIGDSPAEVANLIQLCHDASLSRGQESFTCFVARRTSGDAFSGIAASSIRNQLPADVADRTQFGAATYDSAVIEVGYSLGEDSIVVTK